MADYLFYGAMFFLVLAGVLKLIEIRISRYETLTRRRRPKTRRIK